ncbi:hypothetical protein NQ318_022614 [Aromia moschata]|uniref:PiggyBac transposable element-derived protein domain-containing protein n=1 Tax=Aromia moschata TaxID=1265417 RepID=A0AAV8XC63_9CUCU|nr:hypothetical protein NQ318_022614 [Aromia moschata]
MIEYYGRHGCKQYIHGKPIRFGYKVWCMNAKNGYLINFETYQGTISKSNVDDQKKYGKAAAPLLQFIKELPEKIKLLPLRFYPEIVDVTMVPVQYAKTVSRKAAH